MDGASLVESDSLVPRNDRMAFLDREAAEVYLLLDFLSGQADRSLRPTQESAFAPSSIGRTALIPAVLSGHRFCPRSSGEGRDAFGHLHQLVPGATTCLDDGVVAVPDTVA